MESKLKKNLFSKKACHCNSYIQLVYDVNCINCMNCNTNELRYTINVINMNPHSFIEETTRYKVR